jgi:hypothetical protein
LDERPAARIQLVNHGEGHAMAEALEFDALYIAGRDDSQTFIDADTIQKRAAAFDALQPPPFAAGLAKQTVGLDDPGPRVVVLEAVTAYHSQAGDGARAAGIVKVIYCFYKRTKDGPPGIERDIARKALSSTSTSFAYGALRAGYRNDMIAFAEECVPHIRRWGQEDGAQHFEDAARTLETLIAEALLDMGQLDPARARFPKEAPSDPPGKTLWERIHRRLFTPTPSPGPDLKKQYCDAIAKAETLLSLLRANPTWAVYASDLQLTLDTERAKPKPKSDAEWLKRLVEMMDVLRRLTEAISGAIPGAV